MSDAKRFVWTLDDLREDLARWEQELRSTTNAEGQHYPEHTIKPTSTTAPSSSAG
jgi:hypothetical protein